MADVNAEHSGPSVSRGPLFYVGATGLLAAMAVEALAVLGRHAGIPFLGALEIIQTAILLTATSAMVSTTLNHSHARVTILIDRLGPTPRAALRAFSALLSALFFVGLTAGTLWLTVDAWNEYEQSELLRIPFRPLRVISFAAGAAIALLFVRDMFRPAGDRR
jgi:TRAP-type C4-dicarboxylate transport system permease small subunit